MTEGPGDGSGGRAQSVGRWGPDDPHLDARKVSSASGQAGRQQPGREGPAPPRRAGRDPRVPRGLRAYLPGGRHRVSTSTTSSVRATAIGPTSPTCGSSTGSSTRSSRSGRRSAWIDQPRAVRPVVGRHPRDGVRAPPPGAPQGPDRLEHDVELPGVQRLRARGPDARDGPGGPRRDQGLRGASRDGRSAVRRAAHGASLRPPRPADARGRVARRRDPVVRGHQSPDLRLDAGAERARR